MKTGLDGELRRSVDAVLERRVVAMDEEQNLFRWLLSYLVAQCGLEASRISIEIDLDVANL